MEPLLGLAPELWENAAQSEIPEIDQAMLKHGVKYSGHQTSMLQDILKGRRTEIDEWNGYVIRKGKKTGIPTPVNEIVLDMFKQVESGQLKYSQHNINALLGLIRS